MIRVALIDGPLPTDFSGLSHQEEVAALHPRADQSPAQRHAMQMAMAMQTAARAAGTQIGIDNYVVFPGHLGCSLEAVCAAIDLARVSDAQILHCSFGVPRADPRLTSVIDRALSDGKHVVASAAARGGVVYPAACDGVMSVQGDARCNAGDWSWLGLPHAEFGACVHGEDPDIQGASVAAAHFTGHLAGALVSGEAHLMVARAALQGRERILHGAKQKDIPMRDRDHDRI